MATVDKNFRIKNGLAVEGSTATVNGNQILTENASDQYILNLIGGETLVKSVASGLSVDVSGELSINRTVVDGWYDAAGSASDAQTAAESYADGLASNYDPAGAASTAQTNAQNYADTAASNAQSAAEDYADGLISTEVTNRNNAIATAKSEAISTASDDATSKANTAESNANGYTDSAISTEVTNRNNAIDDAISAEVSDRDSAISTAITNLNLAGTYDALGAADAALSDANDYTDQKVADLVDGAPALLDTLNELAAAIADNPNYATDVANLVATKADTTYVDSEISGVDSAAQGYATSAENAAKGYADSLASNYDAAGAATTAYNNAVSYTDQEISALDSSAQDYADTAEQNAKNYADGLAVNYDAAGDAAAAQTAAETTAQNALNDVLDGTTPFTDLNINDVAKQVASRVTSQGSVTATAYQFNKSSFKSGKFLVKIDNGTHNEISEILVTLDSSDNVAITEYAIVGTNGSRGTITADVDSTHCRIRVTPVNDSTITVAGTIFNS